MCLGSLLLSSYHSVVTLTSYCSLLTLVTATSLSVERNNSPSL